MGWETVEELPGARGGSAFRGAAEPVVAERRGLSPLERLRLFWHSTPEQPVERTAERVVVTPQHVYVRRVDGTTARVRIEQVHGDRLDRGRMIYGVREDEDLLLVYRSKCAVQDRLAAIVRGAEAIEPWRKTSFVIASLIFAVAGIGAGIGLLLSYPLAPTLDHIARGFWTSEMALGTYAGIASLLFAVLLILLGPARMQIDAVGVTRSRGLLPWFVFSIAPTEALRTCIRPIYFQPKGRAQYHAGWRVDLELREALRFGKLGKSHLVPLERFLFERPYTDLGKANSETAASTFSDRVKSLLSLDEETLVEDARTRRW